MGPLEQILDVGNLGTPDMIGKIAGAASVIGFALFIYSMGLDWIKNAVKSWRSDDPGAEINSFGETVRKISLLVLISSFTLLSDVIVSVVNYAIAAVEVEDVEHDEAKQQLDAYIDLYVAYAYYFNLLDNYQSASTPSQKSAAAELLEMRYPNKMPRSYPVTDGWIDSMSVSFEMVGVSMGTSLSTGFSSFLLWIGWALGTVFKFFFAILFQVLLALLPLSLAFSIPVSQKNSYNTMIRRLFNVGMAFVVLELLEQFTVGVYNDLSAKCAALFMQGQDGGGTVAEFDEMLYFALPVFAIAMMGLYSKSLWIASSVTGGGDGEGGVATSGMAMGIGALAVAVGGAKAAASAAGGLKKK